MIAVCSPGIAVLAADPITVDVVVLGDDPVVTLEADGDNATVYINGQDLAEPTVIKHNISTTTIRRDIREINETLAGMDSNLYITSEGLANALLVLGEHTDNLKGLLDALIQLEQDSLARDNELVTLGEDRDVAIEYLDGEIVTLKGSVESANNSTAKAIKELKADYDNKIAELNDVIATTRSEYNFKIIVLIIVTVLLGVSSIITSTKITRLQNK